MKKKWINLLIFTIILTTAAGRAAVFADAPLQEESFYRADASVVLESMEKEAAGSKKTRTKTWLAQADITKTGETKYLVEQKKNGKWVTQKGYVYYYTPEGKKLKNGIHTIDGKKYYFDEKGRQMTGWRKYKGHSYFFRYKNGKQGYMVTDRKVDGISLKKNGRAAPKGNRAKRKLPILLEVQKLTDTIVKPTMNQSKKLWIAFEYVKNHYRGAIIPELGHSHGDWDLNYVSYMLRNGRGDCYCYAATFAYYANALGFKNVLTVNSGGHGWAEIDGKAYDPNWAHVIGSAKCYAVPASLSGRDGRPNWMAYRTYLKNCDT